MILFKPMISIIMVLCCTAFSDSLHTMQSIAVIDFKGDGLEQGVANNFSNRFRKLALDEKRYYVVERDNMNAILKEQGFQQTGCTSTECVVDAGKMIGVNFVVAGGVGKVGLLYILNARLINVETGKIEREVEFSERITIEDFYIRFVEKLYTELFLGSSIEMSSAKNVFLFNIILQSNAALRKDSIYTSEKLEEFDSGSNLQVYGETRYYYYVKSPTGRTGYIDKAWTQKIRSTP